MSQQSTICGERIVARHAGAASETASSLDRLLRRALLALGEAGQTDCACRLAAEAWSALRHERPRDAERYSGLLHFLTASKRRLDQ